MEAYIPFFILIKCFNDVLENFEQSNGLMRILYTLPLALSGSLVFQMLFGEIITIIGAITIWKRYFGLAIVSLCLAVLLLNWIGSILTIIGAILGIILWRHQQKE